LSQLAKLILKVKTQSRSKVWFIVTGFQRNRIIWLLKSGYPLPIEDSQKATKKTVFKVSQTANRACENRFFVSFSTITIPLLSRANNFFNFSIIFKRLSYRLSKIKKIVQSKGTNPPTTQNVEEKNGKGFLKLLNPVDSELFGICPQGLIFLSDGENYG
jgi:hypothetical protein